MASIIYKNLWTIKLIFKPFPVCTSSVDIFLLVQCSQWKPYAWILFIVLHTESNCLILTSIHKINTCTLLFVATWLQTWFQIFYKSLQNSSFTIQEYTIVTIYTGRQVFAVLQKIAGCKLMRGMGRKTVFLTQESLARKNVFSACEGKIHSLPGKVISPSHVACVVNIYIISIKKKLTKWWLNGI